MRNSIAKFLFGLLLLGTPQLATGELIILFSDDGGSSFKTEFEGSVGSSQSISVYLGDTLTGGELETNGLLRFGLVAVPDTTSVASFSSSTINPDFISNTNASNSNALDWSGTALFAPKGQQILLGSFVISANNLGVAIYSFADSQPGTGITNQNWTSGTFAELDQIIFGAGASGTHQFTFTAVPEPSSLLGFGLFVFATASRRRR